MAKQGGGKGGEDKNPTKSLGGSKESVMYEGLTGPTTIALAAKKVVVAGWRDDGKSTERKKRIQPRRANNLPALIGESTEMSVLEALFWGPLRLFGVFAALRLRSRP